MHNFWRYFLFILVFSLGFGLGVFRYEMKDQSNLAVLIPIENKTTFQATVVDEPQTTDNQIKLIFQPDGSSLKVLASVSLGGDYRYGDRFKVSGTFTRPGIIGPSQSRAGEDDEAFDYGEYLAKDEIYFLLNRPKLERLPEIGGSQIRRSLFDFKHLLLDRLSNTVPEPEFSLLGGILLGGRGSLGQAEEDSLRSAGLIHMIVLSGYNLSVVGEWITRALAFLPARVGIFGAAGSLIAFALMAGGGAATTRAVVMALIALFARLTGQQYNALRALIAAGLLMIIINPKVLVYDLGFHLSFLATLGLIVASPLLERRLQFIPARFGFRSVAVSTISAQLFVLPWLLYWIGNFSIWTLPANLLTLPIVPLAMFLTFLTIVVGLILPPLAFPFGFLAYLLAAYVLGLAGIVARLPLSNFHFSSFPLWLTTVLYFALGYWLLKEKKKYPSFNPKT